MDTLRDKNHLEELWASGKRALEGLVMHDRRSGAGKRVLVTGHTGFKGAWLALWLQPLGARGHRLRAGAADRPAPVRRWPASARGDRSTHRATSATSAALRAAIATLQPEIVFHLAAQPLVRAVLRRPGRDLRDQRDGHGARARGRARARRGVRAVVIVTSDKCYENREWVWGYRENDPLGGHDPYSSSKGCAELVTAAYRALVLRRGRAPARRLGARRQRDRRRRLGGRPAHPRHRARRSRRASRCRSATRSAIRPWQHVLEPLRRLPAARRAPARSAGDVRRGLELRPGRGGRRPGRDRGLHRDSALGAAGALGRGSTARTRTRRTS